MRSQFRVGSNGFRLSILGLLPLIWSCATGGISEGTSDKPFDTKSTWENGISFSAASRSCGFDHTRDYLSVPNHSTATVNMNVNKDETGTADYIICSEDVNYIQIGPTPWEQCKAISGLAYTIHEIDFSGEQLTSGKAILVQGVITATGESPLLKDVTVAVFDWRETDVEVYRVGTGHTYNFVDLQGDVNGILKQAVYKVKIIESDHNIHYDDNGNGELDVYLTGGNTNLGVEITAILSAAALPVSDASQLVYLSVPIAIHYSDGSTVHPWGFGWELDGSDPSYSFVTDARATQRSDFVIAATHELLHQEVHGDLRDKTTGGATDYPWLMCTDCDLSGWGDRLDATEWEMIH